MNKKVEVSDAQPPIVVDTSQLVEQKEEFQPFDQNIVDDAKGRCIIENVLLTQEIVADIRLREKPANVVLKLDMEKAYDRVSWMFLVRVSRKMGFAEVFIDMVWRLIANNCTKHSVAQLEHAFAEPTKFVQNTSSVYKRESQRLSWIMKDIKDVIQQGATRVLVLGIYPLGCLPLYLTSFPNNNTSAYDNLGCLRNYNDFASYHNRYVNRAIANLQRSFPNVSIVYGDFYGAILTLIRSPSLYGFTQNTLLSACCGTGGRHNFKFGTVCGAAGMKACSNPTQYVHWDGIHLTDEAHRRITDILDKDMLSKFNCVV
ncbi:GDSL esterase/lipase At5g03980-like [Lycium barbarum]|uniref:GDSL esterase/lipase At5g03980-like n=1 Tax=Lycium barbarum TaxID=112863 RepID=UPI00293ED02C|nr:GDSL esterase/lipase At5g03980-like [Lycium barbarum]